MRPAAATSLLSQHAELLPDLDGSPRKNRGIDGLEVSVAKEPPVGVENIDRVVFAVRIVWDLGVLAQRFSRGGNNKPIAGGNDVDQSLAAADIQARMVIDRPVRGGVAAVDKRG